MVDVVLEMPPGGPSSSQPATTFFGKCVEELVTDTCLARAWYFVLPGACIHPPT